MKCYLHKCALPMITVLFFGTFRHACGLKCYQCSTIKNSHGCYPQDLRKDFLSECNSKGGVQPMCRTISQVQYFTPDQELTIVRECAYIHSEKDECEKSKFSTMHYSQSCECGEDGCNGATLHRISWSLIVLLAAIAWVIK